MADKRIMVRVSNGVGDPVPRSIPTSTGLPLYVPKDTVKGIRINDTRKFNPITNQPLGDNERKSIDVDPGLIKDIVGNAKMRGIDPLTALAVSYQETQLNKDAPFNINPMVYGKPTGNAEEGLKSLEGQFQYAKNLQQRGVIPQGEDYLIQGNNGYGIIKRGHADLEGAHKIYGVPIPNEGVNLKHNPMYGKTVLSLKGLLKNNPQIMDIINNTEAYSQPNKVMVKIRK